MDYPMFDKVIEALQQATIEVKDTLPSFADKRYRPVPLDAKNFKVIGEVKTDRSIAFVDGGQAELIKAVNLSLQFIRVYYVVYRNNKKIKSGKEEFYILITSFNEEGNIKYKAEIFGPAIVDPKDLVVDRLDPTLAEGLHEVNISKIGEMARRFSELKTAENLMKILNPHDVIILDGTLQSSVTNERNYFNSLYEKALEKKVIIGALSKTSALLTDKGNSLVNVLNQLQPFQEWYYYPVVQITHPGHRAEMFMVKLHPKTKYIFRLEIFQDNEFDINQISALLKENSKDPVFLGYPYGLIDADRNARVSNREMAYFKTLLMSKSGKHWKSIEEAATTADAHGILDRIT